MDVVSNHRHSRFVQLLTTGWSAAVILALFYGVLLLSLHHKSITADELGHAGAGYAYWKFNDYRFDPENGNLSKRWIALPMLFTEQKFTPTDHLAWLDANTWLVSDEWLNRMGNNVEKLLFQGRAMAGLVAVALGVLVWFWSRQLFGPWGGMLSLALYVVNPTILANGGLMTSDTPAALGFLLAMACIWNALHRVSFGWMAANTIAIGVLFLAKMSAVIVIPIAFVLIVARIIDGRPLPVGKRMLNRRCHQAIAFGAIVVTQALAVSAVVWTAYGFRFSAFNQEVHASPRFFRPWEWALKIPPPPALIEQLDLTSEQRAKSRMLESGEPFEWSNEVIDSLKRFRECLTPAQLARLDELLRAPPQHWVPRLIDRVRKSQLLPEAFLFGYAHVWRTSGRMVAFLNGEIRDTGWKQFFPYTFAVKTPLALLGLLAIAAHALYRCALSSSTQPAFVRGGLLYSLLPIGVLYIIYWAFAVASNLNIGHRHLLPTYPVLFICCGSVVPWIASLVPSFRGRRLGSSLRLVVIGLVAILSIEAAFWFPNYLAYFNGIIEPRNGYRHLVDSSLDWGQELPAIAEYLKQYPDEPAYLAYFGVGSPRYYGISARIIGGMPGRDGQLVPPLKVEIGKSEAEISALLRDHPEYDPELVLSLNDKDHSLPGVALLQRSKALRLTGGIYVISATTLQPLRMGKVTGYWDETQEKNYRLLEKAVRPFLSDDPVLKFRTLARLPPRDWVNIFNDYYDFRLARLTAYLRKRDPDKLINFSVLVYRLTDEEVSRALNGPV